MNCGSLSQMLKSIHGSSTMKELEAGHSQSNTSTYANIISTINQILVIMQSTVLYQPIPSPSSMLGKSTYVMFLGFACLNFQNTPMEMLVCQLCSILSKSQLQSHRQLQALIQSELRIKDVPCPLQRKQPSIAHRSYPLLI